SPLASIDGSQIGDTTIPSALQPRWPSCRRNGPRPLLARPSRGVVSPRRQNEIRRHCDRRNEGSVIGMTRRTPFLMFQKPFLSRLGEFHRWRKLRATEPPCPPVRDRGRPTCRRRAPAFESPGSSLAKNWLRGRRPVRCPAAA